MKRIISALCCASTIWIGTNSYAAEPLSFGLKGGFLNSYMTGLDSAKQPFTDAVEAKMFNPEGLLAGYVEYAFHDNVGVNLELNGSLGQIGSYAPKGKDETYSITAGPSLNIIPSLVIYPMGYEDAVDGCMRIILGPHFAMLNKVAGKRGSQKEKEASSEVDLNNFRMGGFLDVSYELPIGVMFSLRGLYDFTDVFKENSTFKSGELGLTKTTDTKLWNVGLTVGYNFGVLLED